MSKALLTDFYQLTMMQGYFDENIHKKQVVFDMFYRENPGGSGFAIMAGLEQLMEYIDNLRFDETDIEFLKSQGCFTNKFLEYLQDFKFTGSIDAIKEGEVVLAGEPLITVKAPIVEAQFLETALLNIINHQCLIATKAARICYAAGDNLVLEFGLRRAQGPDAAIYGARAAVIGGCFATSNVEAGQRFGLPLKGTHAHSWIMSFNNELEAFRAYAKSFSSSCILLVDTYDTLKFGVPNAIKVFDELKAGGYKLENYGIRLDSGDFAYLSKQARRMLDEQGHKNAKITASCDLDEYLIESLKLQGAVIDTWGVGTSLITSKDCPAFGGVYKLVAVEDKNGNFMPKIKLSDNPEKVTNPGQKKLYRFYDSKNNKIKADLVALYDEVIEQDLPYTLFDPKNPWKNMTLHPGKYYIRELLQPIYINGERVYQSPNVLEIRGYCKSQLDTLWDEHRRLINPHHIPVDLSQKLYDIKKDMMYSERH